MQNKILAELNFSSVINESSAQTQTGNELLNKYKSILMANEVTCALVNNFVKEAYQVYYDSGVVETLNEVSDYIQSNKVSWALATACENINNNNKSYNYLNINAAKQVSNLLEMNEEDVIKYIKAGALKNVMFCEAFRNIAKQVYKDNPIIETNLNYTRIHPISITEKVEDGICFEVKGTIYKIDNDKKIQEISPNEVSHEFKMISNLLESNMTSFDNHEIIIKFNKYEYHINENNKVEKISSVNNTRQILTNEQLRENNKLMLNTINPKYKYNYDNILESIALICENYDNIVNMDNVSIYSTKNDEFFVIESDIDIYAKLLKSNHSSQWIVNENAIEALAFIKNKTNTTISENYNEMINKQMEQISDKEKQDMLESLEKQKINNIKERIELLTEKFKNDPVKLAVLSRLAHELNS